MGTGPSASTPKRPAAQLWSGVGATRLGKHRHVSRPLPGVHKAVQVLHFALAFSHTALPLACDAKAMRSDQRLSPSRSHRCDRGIPWYLSPQTYSQMPLPSRQLRLNSPSYLPGAAAAAAVRLSCATTAQRAPLFVRDGERPTALLHVVDPGADVTASGIMRCNARRCGLRDTK